MARARSAGVTDDALERLGKAGVNFKGVRMPAFKGGGETVTAVMGGHADARAGPGTAAPGDTGC